MRMIFILFSFLFSMMITFSVSAQNKAPNPFEIGPALDSLDSDTMVERDEIKIVKRNENKIKIQWPAQSGKYRGYYVFIDQKNIGFTQAPSIIVPAGVYDSKNEISVFSVEQQEVIGKRYNFRYTCEQTEHLGREAKVKLKTNPHSRYAGSGANMLIDGWLGGYEFSDGCWLGFESDDLEATVDFGKPVNLKTVEVNFLEDQSAWIFYPKKVNIEQSLDGRKWKTIKSIELGEAVENGMSQIQKISCDLNKGTLQYLRVFAENVKICPAWHHGGGGPAFIFVDEVVVK